MTNEPIIRVLTLYEPYATLLAYGFKQWETRPKHTSHIGQPYLIHSAQRFTEDQEDYAFCFAPVTGMLKSIGITQKADFHLGHIIGRFEVAECCTVRTGSFHYSKEDKQIRPPAKPELILGDYSNGRSVWKGRNHQLLRKPMPYKGGQGFYQRFKGDYASLEFYTPEISKPWKSN